MNHKRQSDDDFVIGDPSTAPQANPSDIALAYMSSNCKSGASTTIINQGSDRSLSTGAWVAIAVAVMICGVFLVVGAVLLYVKRNQDAAPTSAGAHFERF